MILLKRSSWGAKYGRGSFRPGPKPIVLVHHFAEPHVPCGVGIEEEASRMRGVEDYHVNDPQHKWDGIGYNFVIFQSGHVYEGRGWDRQGAHEEKVNSVSVGVAFAMNAEEHEPTDAAIEAFHQLFERGVSRGYIHEGAIIKGHRDFDDETECPGDNLYSILGELDPR